VLLCTQRDGQWLSILKKKVKNMMYREVQEILAGRTHWVGVEEACIATGLGRSRLYQLFDDVPEIKTCSLKRPGTTKGRRLIHLPSLLGYLEELAIAQGGGAQ
jgi:hypothetical protein